MNNNQQQAEAIRKAAEGKPQVTLAPRPFTSRSVFTYADCCDRNLNANLREDGIAVCPLCSSAIRFGSQKYTSAQVPARITHGNPKAWFIGVDEEGNSPILYRGDGTGIASAAEVFELQAIATERANPGQKLTILNGEKEIHLRFTGRGRFGWEAAS